MHQRPFKEVYEEIYPLNLFVTHRYSGREDILVTPNLDNRQFDAIIRDGPHLTIVTAVIRWGRTGSTAARASRSECSIAWAK
jgi:hypothetical protein